MPMTLKCCVVRRRRFREPFHVLNLTTEECNSDFIKSMFDISSGKAKFYGIFDTWVAANSFVNLYEAEEARLGPQIPITL